MHASLLNCSSSSEDESEESEVILMENDDDGDIRNDVKDAVDVIVSTVCCVEGVADGADAVLQMSSVVCAGKEQEHLEVTREPKFVDVCNSIKPEVSDLPLASEGVEHSLVADEENDGDVAVKGDVTPNKARQKTVPDADEKPLKPLGLLVDTLFDDMSRKKFCFNTMKEIAERGMSRKGCDKNFAVNSTTFKKAADRLVLVNSEVDIRVRTLYLKVLKALFLTLPDINSAMEYVYSLEFRNEGDMQLPQFAYYCKGYEEEMKQLLSKIEKSTALRRDNALAFFLMIMPCQSSYDIIKYCIETCLPERTIYIIKALRPIKAFFTLKMKKQSSNRRDLVIVASLNRYFASVQNGRLQDDSQFCKNFFWFVTKCVKAFVRRDNKVEPPTFGATEFFNDFIVPKLLQWNPHDNKDAAVLCFSLDLLNGLLEQSKRTYCEIRFRSSDASVDSVNAGKVLARLSDILLMESVHNFLKYKALEAMHRIHLHLRNLNEIDMDLALWRDTQQSMESQLRYEHPPLPQSFKPNPLSLPPLSQSVKSPQPRPSGQQPPRQLKPKSFSFKPPSQAVEQRSPFEFQPQTKPLQLSPKSGQNPPPSPCDGQSQTFMASSDFFRKNGSDFDKFVEKFKSGKQPVFLDENGKRNKKGGVKGGCRNGGEEITQHA